MSFIDNNVFPIEFIQQVAVFDNVLVSGQTDIEIMLLQLLSSLFPKSQYSK